MEGVLADVDASLSAWLGAELPAGATIDFASPAGLVDHRRTAKSARTINLFLHDIVEELEGMSGTDVYLRDASGRVSAMHAPLRRYRLTYLVTAWASDTEEEHRFLGLVLAAHSRNEVLTAPWLCGSLRQLNIPMPIRLGMVSTGVADVGRWAALGLPARAGIELTITAPVPPDLRTDIAPPVRRVDLDAHDIHHEQVREG
jgi:hypothetical protein